MLYAFAFDRLGVVVSDLFFVDPNPGKGQEGPEQGVRLEIRAFETGALRGSIYSARPIAIERPIWRADLLESVGNPGTLDRAHHHPRFQEWEPGRRRFTSEMTADPVAWVGKRLSDVSALLDEAGLSPDEVGSADVEGMQAAVPQILDAVSSLLALARRNSPADAADRASARDSWL